MPLVNEISRERLRQLSALETELDQVLSVYFDLDSAQFGVGEARNSEISSLIDGAHREIEAPKRPHAELMSLRADLERVERFLRERDGWTEQARALAIFRSQPLDLFEALKLPAPVERQAVIGKTPFLSPLIQVGSAGRSCVAIANERIARILRGQAGTLREVLSFGEYVHGRHHAGGWSQANYQRRHDNEVKHHVRHVAETLEQQFRLHPATAC